MKIKRIIAYVIDYIIITIIASLLFSLPVFKTYYTKYEESSTEYIDLVLNNTNGSADISDEEVINYLYNVEYYSKPLIFIQLGISILYFGVLAYLLKGQTLGKKIMRIQVVSVKDSSLNVSKFMLRSILVSNWIPQLLSALAITFCPKENWYNYQNIISYVQYSLYFLMIGFMVFRDDERGLHDLLGDTKVIAKE